MPNFHFQERVKDLRPCDYGEGVIVGYVNEHPSEPGDPEYWVIRWDDSGLDNEWLQKHEFEILDDHSVCRDCPRCSHAECVHKNGPCEDRNGCDCSGFIRATRVFMFTNGTVAVCDEKGNQIPEFQGTWINFDYLRKLAKTIKKDNPKTEGVLRLPTIIRQTLFPEKD